MSRPPTRLLRTLLASALVCAVGATTSAVADPPAAEKPPTHLTFAAGGLRQLEPARMVTPEEERIVLAVFEGLTRLDPVTGAVKPAAAESFTTSADGRVWTFKLRAQRWARRSGTATEKGEPVTAADFVFAWSRLLDPDIRSPNVHLLDVIPDAQVIATEGERGTALDRLANSIQDRIGTGYSTLKGDDVLEILSDETLQPRRWLASVADPAAKEFAGWKDSTTPYQGVKSKKLLVAIRAEAAKAIAATAEARAHLGVDRGFFAKDERTLVVQTVGPAPWLPSLLARGPLVAMPRVWIEKKGDNAFRRNAVFSNGPYLADCDLTRSFSGDEEQNFYQIELYRNPDHWDAARAASDRVTGLVNQSLDEVLRLYLVGPVSWVSSTAFTSDQYAMMLASRKPGWKGSGKGKEKLDAAMTKVAGDAFEAPAGGVAFVRFRCVPPFDRADARKAVASLLRREDLVRTWAGGPAPVTDRLVQPRVNGASPTIRLPRFDPAKAKSLYGAKPALPNDWLTIASGSMESGVADAIVKAIKPGVADEATTYSGAEDDLRARIDTGQWNVALTIWEPAFDDPLALLLPFTTGSQAGATQWSNPTFDALVRGAVDVVSFVKAPDATLKDHPACKSSLASASASNPESLETLRRALLAEAEAILLEEAVVVPLWSTVDRGIAKPGVKGLPRSGVARNVLDVIALPAVSAGG